MLLNSITYDLTELFDIAMTSIQTISHNGTCENNKCNNSECINDTCANNECTVGKCDNAACNYFMP
jgi:hypothetical protein